MGDYGPPPWTATMASDNLLLRPRHRCYHCIHAVCGHQDPALCNLLHRHSLHPDNLPTPRTGINRSLAASSTSSWCTRGLYGSHPQRQSRTKRHCRAHPHLKGTPDLGPTVYTTDVVILYPKCDAMPSASILRPVGANFSFLSASPVQEDLSVTSLYL